MFGSIGMTEMLIIAGVALVVIGPEKFPEFAKIVMRTIREVRGYWDDAKRDISRELRPVEDEVRQLKQYNPEDYIDSLTGSDDPEEEKAGPGDYGYEEQQDGDRDQYEDYYNYAGTSESQDSGDGSGGEDTAAEDERLADHVGEPGGAMQDTPAVEPDESEGPAADEPPTVERLDG
ncbi:MAG: twin-arginine translocase subunit TatB [Candidatus Hydrogenedentes bacterium]|nr:twin-arginine translocase subunit TatB [Candidatus Hydrogenedentota bacterium]